MTGRDRLHAAREADGAERLPFDPRAILTSIGETVYDWDIAGDGITWGATAHDLFGEQDYRRFATGRSFATAVEPGSGITRYEAITSAERRDQGSGVPFRAAYAVRLAGGRLLRLEDSGRWFADEAGRPVYAHGIIRVGRGETAETPGNRDRSTLIDRLKGEIVAAREVKQPLSLLIGAIDDLERINEDLGYETTDRLIEAVGGRIAKVLRQKDYFTRYAGNRFAVVMKSCAADQATHAARRIAERMARGPLETEQGPIGIRLALGAASSPDHALDAPTLLRRAEEALSRAKSQPGQSYMLYDSSFARSVRGGARARHLDVIEALNDRRVAFALQPVVDARTRRPLFHEALVRLRTPEGELIGAGSLLPALERAGLVPLIDARMLELVANHLAFDQTARISINLSPVTLESGDWLPLLTAHLAARPGIAGRLIVEITETAALRDPEAIGARLQAIKSLGVAIAIDDFGAGHTSFKHLRNFPIDLIKIDGAFVQNLARSTDDRFFVRALGELAKHLGVATVAEWVEDEESARLLTEWGIEGLQGDHCGAPRLVETPVMPIARVA